MEDKNIGGVFGGIAELQNKIGGTILSIFIGKPAWNNNVRFLRASIFNIVVLCFGIIIAYFLGNGWFVLPFAIFGFGTSIIVSLFKDTNNNENNRNYHNNQNKVNFDYDFTVNTDLFTEPRSGIKIKVFEIQKDNIIAIISNDTNSYSYNLQNNAKKYILNEKFIINGAHNNYHQSVAYEILINEINFEKKSVNIKINQINL